MPTLTNKINCSVLFVILIINGVKNGNFRLIMELFIREICDAAFLTSLALQMNVS